MISQQRKAQSLEMRDWHWTLILVCSLLSALPVAAIASAQILPSVIAQDTTRVTWYTPANLKSNVYGPQRYI